MKFNCGPTWEERCAALEQWHRWFAWYPVRVGPRGCRWLETVERIGHCKFTEWTWVYR